LVTASKRGPTERTRPCLGYRPDNLFFSDQSDGNVAAGGLTTKKQFSTAIF
jgi:hypothetical protein